MIFWLRWCGRGTKKTLTKTTISETGSEVSGINNEWWHSKSFTGSSWTITSIRSIWSNFYLGSNTSGLCLETDVLTVSYCLLTRVTILTRWRNCKSYQAAGLTFLECLELPGRRWNWWQVEWRGVVTSSFSLVVESTLWLLATRQLERKGHWLVWKTFAKFFSPTKRSEDMDQTSMDRFQEKAHLGQTNPTFLISNSTKNVVAGSYRVESSILQN